MKRFAIILIMMLASVVHADICQDEYDLDDYLIIAVTTSQFSTGAAYTAGDTATFDIFEVNAGTPNTTEIDDAQPMTEDFSGNTGLIVAVVQLTSGNGYTAGRSYIIHITATVDSVAAGISDVFYIRTANETNGATLTEAGGTGNHLTAIDLPNQTMDITGTISTVTEVTAIATDGIPAAALKADALTAIESEANDALVALDLDHLLSVTTGVVVDGDLEAYVSEGTVMAHLMGTSNAGTAADVTTFKSSEDALEAIRVRGDSAWITATGFAVSGEPLTAQETEDECIDALESFKLDEWMAEAVTTNLNTAVHDNSAFGYLLASSDVATYDRTTDSQEKLADQIIAGGSIVYVPTGGTITTGNQDAGTYASTATDDATDWTIGDEDGTNTIEVIAEIAMGANRAATGLTINGQFDENGSGSPVVEIYARNYATAGNDDWDKLSAGTADTEMRSRVSDATYVFSLAAHHTCAADSGGDTVGDVQIKFVSTRATTADGDILYLDYIGVTATSSGAVSPAVIADAVWSKSLLDIRQDGNHTLIAGHVVKTLVDLETEIASGGSNTNLSFTLDSGTAANDAYNGMWIWVRDESATNREIERRRIVDWTSGLTVIVDRGFSFLPADADHVHIGGYADVNVTHVGGTAQTANDMSGDIDDVLVDTAAYDSDAEYATAIWNAATASYGGVGTYGQAIEDGTSASAIADAVWNETSTGHTTAGYAGAQLWTDVDAILTDTAVIGALGAGLTAVPWNSAWDAEVQSEATDALNAYDPPTDTEMLAAHTTTDALITTVDNYVDTEIADIIDKLKAIMSKAYSIVTAVGTFDPASDSLEAQQENPQSPPVID